MKKTTILIFWIILLSFPFFKLNANTIVCNPCVNLKYDYIKIFSISNEESLLKGSWQREDNAEELKISSILDTGLLEVNYYAGKRVIIEKAGWTNSSNVLRIFVFFGQEEKTGYSLTLNYLPEKDLLVGIYIDGTTNSSFKVVFKRNK
jgi:hypothetical protein